MTEQEQNFEILDAETVRTIDYILRGLQLGKFDETAKQVEFLEKLSGEVEPKYIATLLKRISTLEVDLSLAQTDNLNLEQRVNQLEQYKTETEAKFNDINNDMQSVAAAIRNLFEPKPLTKNWDMNEINNFCNKHGAMS